MSAYMNRKLGGAGVRCGVPMHDDADTVSCAECRLYAAAWRMANPERSREHRRKHTDRHRERINEAARLRRKRR